jgi:hypothetical protein
MNAQVPVRFLPLGLLVLFLTVGFAPVNVAYGAEPGTVSSSAGGWSVLIAVLSFVAGFLAGATMARSGGLRSSSHRHKHRRRTEAGWKRVQQRIQDGTKQGLADWRSTGRTEDADWSDLNRRIEERIIEEMRKHHD